MIHQYRRFPHRTVVNSMAITPQLRRRFLRRFKQKDRAAGRFGRIGFQRSVLRERHAQHVGGAAVPGRRARLLQIIRSGGKSRHADVPVLRGAQDVGMARVAAAERAREIRAPVLPERHRLARRGVIIEKQADGSG